MPIICVDCVKDSQLKLLFENHGDVGKCELCGCLQLAIDSTENSFFQMAKAIIRYNYSEWDYNGHLGGDSLESLFYGAENLFLYENRALDSETYDDVVQDIVGGNVYEEYDKGVTIFSGYDEHGQQNMPLCSIKSDRSFKLEKIVRRLKDENYFEVETDLQDIISEYKEIATFVLAQSSTLYRARIGYDSMKKSFMKGFEIELHYSPYAEEKIGAPPPSIAASGRANRSGVSFLYCGTDKYTAVSEVRPHPGDKVSIGKFFTTRRLKLFDLATSQLIHFFHCDEVLDNYIHFDTLGKYMNMTITPSEREHYSITQLIADCIRQNGFEGIIFNSTVGTGKNIVLFKPDSVEYVSDEAEVIEVQEVAYSYTPLHSIEKDGLYLEDAQSRRKEREKKKVSH